MAQDKAPNGSETDAPADTPYGEVPSVEDAAEHPPATGPEGIDSTAEGIEDRMPGGAADDG